MSLLPRVRIRELALHVRDTLRTGINAQITAAIAEATGTPPASGLATIGDTTAQIELGDSADYEPILYPSLRLAAPRVRLQPFSSAAVTDAEITLLLGIYTQATAGAGECAGDLIKSLMETTLDLCASVRACLEEDYSSATFGDRLLVLGYEQTTAPQDVDNPCVLRQRYEMTIQIMIRARHSRGATT